MSESVFACLGTWYRFLGVPNLSQNTPLDQLATPGAAVSLMRDVEGERMFRGTLPTGRTRVVLLSISVLAFAMIGLSGCAGVVSGTNPAQTQPTALIITVSSLPAGTLQATYTATVVATGGQSPYTWTVSSGSLPGGLTLSSSGQISGKPTASGAFSFVVKVTDSSSPAQSATASLSIVVAALPTTLQITTTSLASGEVSSAYSATLGASGGKSPYSWMLSSGTLHGGLTLSSSG
jgi:hypothetical protein